MTDDYDMATETETTKVTEDKITIGYARKAGLPNYSSHEVSLFMTVDLPADPQAWLAANGQQKLDVLKAHAYDGLGLDYAMEDGRPVLVKTEVAPAPAPVPQAPVAAPAVGQYAPPQAQAPMAQPPMPSPTPPGGIAAVGVHANFPNRCLKCGNTEFWDNRAENDLKIPQGIKIGPDWKCKNQQCKEGTFREGSYQYNKTAQSNAPGGQAIQQAVTNVAQAFNPPPAQPGFQSPDEAPF